MNCESQCGYTWLQRGKMNVPDKRDLSVSMLRANILGLALIIPVFLILTNIYFRLYGSAQIEINGSALIFFVVLIVSVVVHELIHGLTAMFFTKQPFSTVKFGFNLKTLTPYAHMKTTLEVTRYRIVVFLPGLILGIIPYILGLALGNIALALFGVIHIIAAGGDWLILWLIRKVKPGIMVEDHPTRAGCYVLANPVP